MLTIDKLPLVIQAYLSAQGITDDEDLSWSTWDDMRQCAEGRKAIADAGECFDVIETDRRRYDCGDCWSEITVFVGEGENEQEYVFESCNMA